MTIEGYTPEELLQLPHDQLDAFLLIDSPIVFRIGSAEVLGKFAITDRILSVDLAHIDGGGEGILRVLWRLVGRYAEVRNLTRIDWTVRAVNCAHPNLKLRATLEREGFQKKFVSEGDVQTAKLYGKTVSLVDSPRNQSDATEFR